MNVHTHAYTHTGGARRGPWWAGFDDLDDASASQLLESVRPGEKREHSSANKHGSEVHDNNRVVTHAYSVPITSEPVPDPKDSQVGSSQKCARDILLEGQWESLLLSLKAPVFDASTQTDENPCPVGAVSSPNVPPSHHPDLSLSSLKNSTPGPSRNTSTGLPASSSPAAWQATWCSIGRLGWLWAVRRTLWGGGEKRKVRLSCGTGSGGDDGPLPASGRAQDHLSA